MAAEVIKEPCAAKPTQDVVQILAVAKRELHSEEEDNRRHAAYCVGIIAEATLAILRPNLLQFLQVTSRPDLTIIRDSVKDRPGMKEGLSSV